MTQELPIANCRLSFKLANWQLAIGNWQLSVHSGQPHAALLFLFRNIGHKQSIV
jgi:hypothetical protein